jgi:hypothetical protein
VLRGAPMNIRLTRPVLQQEGPRHVIAEYKHRARTITCECGWHGSSEAGHEKRSPWQEHLAEYRPK